MTIAEADQLRETRTAYVQQLYDLRTKKKPTYSVAGRSFSWVEYRKFLREEILAIDELLTLSGFADSSPPDSIITAIE
ncbi:hypothetical protein BH11PLA2_BH11PLA2_32810 [soil metagenome]